MSVREAMGAILFSFLLALLFVVASCRPARAQSETATKIAAGTYITAAFADASITSYCTGRGVCHEANPFLKPIVEKHSIVAAMTVKGAMHAGISLWLLKAAKEHPKRTFWITVALTGAQVAVDVLNVRTVNR